MALFRCMSNGGGSSVNFYETTIEHATNDTDYAITCGFEPKQIFVYGCQTSADLGYVSLYDVDLSNNFKLMSGGRTSATIAQFNRGNPGDFTARQGGSIKSVNSTGFVFHTYNRSIFTGDIIIKVIG